MLAILFRSFDFIAHKTLNYLAFQCLDFQSNWWRLFQTRVVCTKFNIYVFITGRCKLRDTTEFNVHLAASAGSYWTANLISAWILYDQAREHAKFNNDILIVNSTMIFSPSYCVSNGYIDTIFFNIKIHPNLIKNPYNLQE